jgi:two-component system sensor histidine kinase UhpB
MHLEALERQEQLHKELLRNTIRTQEEERARIARELHDEMAQTLTAFTLDIGTLQNVLPNDNGAHTILDRLQNLSRQMSQSMVQMVYMLRPPHLDELGLVTALKYMLDKDFQRRGLKAKMEINGNPTRIDPLIETVLFRVAQEALTNTLRHAETKEVDLCLEYKPGSVLLKISDKGNGFDPDQVFVAPRGWGLAGMKERAESVGGEMQIESSPSQGTTVEVEIPIPSKQGD